MHARRYFVRALEGGDQRAALPRARVKKLYEIEEKVSAVDDARLAVRQQESRRVHDSLVNWCRVFQREERPSSPLAKAVPTT